MYDVHIVACTIDVQPHVATVDVQTNQLLDLSPFHGLDASGEWEAWSAPEEPKWDIWSPPSASALYHEKWLVSPFVGGAQYPVGWCMNQDRASCYGLSLLEIFFMQQIGINNTLSDPATSTGFSVLNSPPPIPKKVLCSRDLFELALSRAYATLLSTGGQLGADGGGFNRKHENTIISQQVLQWHLGINLGPLAFALTCSLFMLALSMCLTNRLHGRNDTMPINSAGILQIIWLTTRFRVLTDLVNDVEDPQEDILRAAGMVDVNLLQELKDVQVDDC